MHRPIRVGVIGVGLHGMHHVRAYAALPSVDLVAIADVNAERAQSVPRNSTSPTGTQTTVTCLLRLTLRLFPLPHQIICI